MIPVAGRNSPNLVAEVDKLPFVVGIDGELFCRLNEHTVLEVAATKHDRAMNTRIFVDNFLYGNRGSAQLPLDINGDKHVPRGTGLVW